MATPRKKPEDLKKAGRKSSFTAERKAVALAMARMGATDMQIAEHIGVTEQTVNNWKIKFPEFFESLRDLKAQSDNKVERALYELATGYEYDAERPLVVSDGTMNGAHVEIAKYREKQAPNPTAIIFWLKNRQPAKWRDRQEHDVRTEIVIGKPLPPEKFLDNEG